MFTGIIEALGTVAAIEKRGEDFSLTIDCGKLDMSDVKIGDSIAVNGVCLTAVKLESKRFVADVSNETIRFTSLSSLKVNSVVNLEKALTPSSRLGGHLVSGHVDGLGKICERYQDGRAIRFVIEAPKELAKYIAAKGSICVDGISLTVNEVRANKFYLNIVPHTAGQTNAVLWQADTEVNLEVDVIARYLERLLMGDKAADSSVANKTNISEAFLAEHGFFK
jgi:riboflavin synthase